MASFRLPPGLIALPLIIALAIAAPARADINDKLDHASEAVDAANHDVKRALKLIERTNARIPLVQAELDEAEAKVIRLKSLNVESQAKLDDANAQIWHIQGQIEGVKTEVEQTQGDVDALARSMYVAGELSEVGAVLNATDPSDLTRRIATVESVSRANNAQLDVLRQRRAELAMDEVKLGALQEQAQQENDAIQARLFDAKQEEIRAQRARARLVKLKQRQASALRIARAHANDVQARYDELEAEQARIAAAAAAAAAAHTHQDANPSSSGSSGSGLMWPIPGAAVSQNVGPRIHPVYGYKSCHTGTDIRGSEGTAIHAAADGTVIQISSGGAYGNATLIAHGNGISTFYAHQSRFAVQDGERVNKGDVIGYVGSTGWVTGPHLHFEVHVNGKPYDPMGWFGGNRSPVAC